MADPTQPRPQKIDPKWPGSNIFDPDLSLIYTDQGHQFEMQNFKKSVKNQKILFLTLPSGPDHPSLTKLMLTDLGFGKKLFNESGFIS